jgi:hypothetical protein
MKPLNRNAIFLFLFVILLTACGKVDTGIQGKVMLARCTGTQTATDCVGQATYTASLTIYDENLKKIKTVKANGDGTFLIALKPGTYFIHPENSGKFPIAADFRVVVAKGKLPFLTIYYDTGLR